MTLIERYKTNRVSHHSGGLADKPKLDIDWFDVKGPGLIFNNLYEKIIPVHYYWKEKQADFQYRILIVGHHENRVFVSMNRNNFRWNPLDFPLGAPNIQWVNGFS